MAGSARPTVSEYVSSLDPPETPGTFGGRDLVGQRDLARLIEKTNRAKSDLRDLVKKWRRAQASGATPNREIWRACADDLERWLNGGE